MDGGVADNLPIKYAREAGRELGIKRILAVDTRRWRNVPADSLKNGVSVVMRCFEAMVHVSETEGMYGDAHPNLLIHSSDKSSAFDFSRKKELLALGEMTAVQSKDELDAFFRAGFKGALARRRKISCGIELEDYFGGPHA